jgi:hypothetical protein
VAPRVTTPSMSSTTAVRLRQREIGPVGGYRVLLFFRVWIGYDVGFGFGSHRGLGDFGWVRLKMLGFASKV